jgi:predicted nucleic acid-binding protein
MLAAPFKVVVDANVLYPFTLRDTLLRAAAAGYFQLYWSEPILAETTRNLVGNGVITETQAERLRAAMTRAFPESMVADFDSLIPSMLNDEKDRHVAAAALKVGAQVIVTSNLKDFRTLPDGIEAQSPDEFFANLFDLNSRGMAQVVLQQARALKRPPRSVEDVLRGLAKSVPTFAANVSEYLGVTG